MQHWGRLLYLMLHGYAVSKINEFHAKYMKHIDFWNLCIVDWRMLNKSTCAAEQIVPSPLERLCEMGDRDFMMNFLLDRSRTGTMEQLLAHVHKIDWLHDRTFSRKQFSSLIPALLTVLIEMTWDGSNFGIVRLYNCTNMLLMVHM